MSVLKYLLAILYLSNVYAGATTTSGIKPLTDHLMELETDLYVSLYSKSDVTVVENDEAQIKILKERTFYFNVDQNGISIRPNGAVEMCVNVGILGCMQVDLNRIHWNRSSGEFNVDLEMHTDFFGLIGDEVAAGLRDKLKNMLADKFRLAFMKIDEFNRKKDLSQASQLASSLGELLSSSEGDDTTLPEFGGEVGLQFSENSRHSGKCGSNDSHSPQQDYPIHLTGFRIGIRCSDTVTLAARFYHNNYGLSVTGLKLSSNYGINVNEGQDFETSERLIINSLELSENGITSDIELGASHTVMGLLILAELASVATGNPPSGSCQLCPIAELIPFRNEADIALRRQIRGLVIEHRERLVQMNISSEVITKFLENTDAQIAGLECQQSCYQGGDQEIRGCLDQCNNAFQERVGSN